MRRKEPLTEEQIKGMTTEELNGISRRVWDELEERKTSISGTMGQIIEWTDEHSGRHHRGFLLMDYFNQKNVTALAVEKAGGHEMLFIHSINSEMSKDISIKDERINFERLGADEQI